MYQLRVVGAASVVVFIVLHVLIVACTLAQFGSVANDVISAVALCAVTIVNVVISVVAVCDVTMGNVVVSVVAGC